MKETARMRCVASSFQGHQIGRYVVNLVVSDRLEQIEMRLERIVDHDLRKITAAHEGVIRPGCVLEFDMEIIQRYRYTLERLSRGERNCDGGG